MTENQRKALRWLRARNLGAVVTRLGWTWPVHVRNDEDAALAVLEHAARVEAAECVPSGAIPAFVLEAADAEEWPQRSRTFGARPEAPFKQDAWSLKVGRHDFRPRVAS